MTHVCYGYLKDQSYIDNLRTGQDMGEWTDHYWWGTERSQLDEVDKR